ncbi:hypothetical protein FXF50_04725 [Micromonospora sp. AP08]|uniref:BadF/BadG/BcrA/BcrD ATPase family protein n=1 Tax=Micromonospora sp. AP08 TaxID=2604467 RepID=UPI0011D674D7|nr:BadF/BadG/BcrA/BcrD ATPase family protein [Micromonospora sp. AP08]TYB39687.1 hypothetical protein FXF50_04725 [Micromonospora sp. AP08]
MDLVLNRSGSMSLLVEGGGSHTWVAVTDGERVRAEAKLPSLNTIGAPRGTPRALLRQVAAVTGGVTGIEEALFAVGAVGTWHYLEEFSKLLVNTLPESLRPVRRTFVTNDVVPLLFAEDRRSQQLVVIAGTGSGVTARRGFEAVARHGAHEYLFGDDGGAYDIGRQALRAVIAAAEGRGEPTQLAALVERRTGGMELDYYVYGSDNPKQTVADFARDVFVADQDGDQTAQHILDCAADRLVDVCRGALTAVGAKSPVTATFTGTLVTEPTGRLRTRLERRLLALGATAFRSQTVDVALMCRALKELQSDQALFDRIAGAVPTVRL